MTNRNYRIRNIWSSDVDEMYPDHGENYESFNEWLEINEYPVPPREKYVESVRGYLESCVADDWQLVVSEINYFEKKHGTPYYVIQADLGLWDGRHAGGKVVCGLANALEMTMEDYTKIYIEGGLLKVRAAHHDGTNHFKIRELTDCGADYYERHNGCMDDRELHEKLFNNYHYSRHVRAFNQIYGW